MLKVRCPVSNGERVLAESAATKDMELPVLDADTAAELAYEDESEELPLVDADYIDVSSENAAALLTSQKTRRKTQR